METTIQHVVGWGGVAALVLSGVWLFLNSTALRDESTQSPRPYSLSRVQLAWWTLIVIGSYLAVYAREGQFWPLNGTCLSLLGVGAATGVAGRIVDTRQQEAQVPRHQDAEPSHGLFADILSDENGVSIHRFQTVVCNVAFALSFLVGTFQQPGATTFPTFDATTLLLLGMSSSVYIAIKSNETYAPAPARAGVTAASSAPSALSALSAPSAPVQPVAESGPVATRAS